MRRALSESEFPGFQDKQNGRKSESNNFQANNAKNIVGFFDCSRTQHQQPTHVLAEKF
jgi:hypothetical protein